MPALRLTGLAVSWLSVSDRNYALFRIPAG